MRVQVQFNAALQCDVTLWPETDGERALLRAAFDRDPGTEAVVNVQVAKGLNGYGAQREQPTLCVLPIEVQGIVKADLEQPWLTVEQIISDIKTAIETDDAGLGGLLTKTFVRGRTRTVPREPGATVVGAGLEYRFTYAEFWGGGQA